MPRIPRSLILEEDYQTHKIWRSHNKEWNISTPDEKLAYMDILNELIVKQKNELNVIGLMSNHTHELYKIIEKIKFSDLMRDHHSRYGVFYNKKFKRIGKVAYDRPRTCLIEDNEYSMRATFYIHANPVRAGITKNAADYKWTTHKLYAFGKREPYMKNVVFPDWYMSLGDTWEKRRAKYRRLFDQYLLENGLIKQDFLWKKFYGSILWTINNNKRISQWLKKKDLLESPP